MKIFTTYLFLFFSVLLAAQPVYDDCNTAFDLGDAPICLDDVFTNVDATESTISSNPSDNIPSCWSGVAHDVWFQFTPPIDGSHLDFEITVAGVTDGPNNQSIIQPEIAIYRGDCSLDGLAELTCATSGTGQTALQLQVLGLDSGESYYIRINDIASTGTPNWGDFSICVDSLSACFDASAAQNNICAGESVQLLVSDQSLSNYVWEPAASLSNPNIAEPVAFPTITTTYTVTAFDGGDDLIVNGDFENGNVDFFTEYFHGPDSLPVGMYGFLSNEGAYIVDANPNNGHINFANCPDHTTGTGNMMIVNGSQEPDLNVWCQTVNVEPNTEYLFSSWLTSVEQGNPAVLQFSINESLLDAPFMAPFGLCDWQQFNATWNSGSNFSAVICITNQNTELGGNDFAIDDISFRPITACVETVTIEVSDPTLTIEETVNIGCMTGCVGTATVSASGGFGNYTYAWSNNQQGPTANNLCAGVYNVTVTDNTGCSATTAIEITAEELSASVVELSNICEPSNVGSAQVFVNTSSSLPPFTYLWDNGEVTETAVNLANGMHQVTVTDASGCQAIVSVDISVDPDGFTIEIAAPTTQICSGESVALEGIGLDVDTYQWSDGTALNTTMVAPTETTTYSLLATKRGGSLILNGDFELGAMAL